MDRGVSEPGVEEVDLLLLENGEKTVPSTRFAFSREASFLNSTVNREGFLGGGGGGVGRRSIGTNPAGKRVMCIECGRRCLGRQGGEGSRFAWACFAIGLAGVYRIVPLDE